MKKTLVTSLFSLAFLTPFQASATALSGSQVSAILGLLRAFGADASIVSNVESSLTGVPPTGGTFTAPFSCTLARTLVRGAQGNDVACVQRFFIAQQLLAAGNDTGYFGPFTEVAVQRFQREHSIVSSGTPQTTGFGSIGPKTRAALYASAGRPNVTPIAGPVPDTSASGKNGVGAGSSLRPTVTLTANLAVGSPNVPVALTWEARNATSCVGTGFTASATSGSVTVLPARTTAYSITCVGSGGSADASVTISVGSYFTQAMSSQVQPAGLQIIRQNTQCPPSDSTDSTTFNQFPITLCQDQNMVSAATLNWHGGAVMHMLWENRVSSGKGYSIVSPNPVPYPASILPNGERCWLDYSSFARAEAATRAEIAYSAGAPAHNAAKYGYLDITEAAGFPDAAIYMHDVFTGAKSKNYTDSAAASLCTGHITSSAGEAFTIATDVVVLPAGRLVDVKGVSNDGFLIDYEPQDGRTNSVSQIRQEAAIAAYYGYPVSIYTNPVDGNTAVYDNWTTTTLPQILALSNVKRFSILIAPPRTGDDPSSNALHQSLLKQLTLMNGGTLPSTSANFLSKVFINFQIGSSATTWPTIAHTRTIHNDIVKWHIPTVDIFPNGASFAGPACPVPDRDVAILATLLGVRLPCAIPANY